ncbi:hypothetical protein CSV80_05995 [Sporosarcina sp. P12(2017)]|uniref:hypothetical protein n=1 Tax=unclassified Sporosarcina TaxID=2647733 RepID=UPI000C173373|nr:MULTISPECIES: hypothetical protein [unclassified Sporosarcina]PIC57860.1 hypothetical protein CSV81_06140 [Sporosarcina sp. P10]PIC61242.1 hypothetical protein CSV80_05995 [Sporosarcina sp. P12(2017)]
MRLFAKLGIIVFSTLLLTACFGEDYDFTPPDVTLMNHTEYPDTEELTAVNIEWDSDKLYTKKTDDILSVARDQKTLVYHKGQEVRIVFVTQDFAIRKLSAYVMKDGIKTEIEVDGEVFNMPNEKGEYIIVLHLLADSGTVEYVGNVLIE